MTILVLIYAAVLGIPVIAGLAIRFLFKKSRPSLLALMVGTFLFYIQNTVALRTQSGSDISTMLNRIVENNPDNMYTNDMLPFFTIIFLAGSVIMPALFARCGIAITDKMKKLPTIG